MQPTKENKTYGRQSFVKDLGSFWKHPNKSMQNAAKWELNLNKKWIVQQTSDVFIIDLNQMRENSNALCFHRFHGLCHRVFDGIKTDQKRVWTTNPFVQGGPGYSPFRLVPAIFACLIKFQQKASSRRQI
jgi:hypothetical protein